MTLKLEKLLYNDYVANFNRMADKPRILPKTLNGLKKRSILMPPIDTSKHALDTEESV